MYFPRYYYSPASAYGQSKEQNCFILSDRYLLTYSDNFSSAVLYNEPELLAFYGEVFENRMESSSSLLEQGGSLGIFPEEPWMKLFRAEENEVYFCIPGIGSSFFVGDNEDLFRSYISDTVEEKEELIRFRLSYGDRLQKAVRRLGGSIRIISACNAVERFVREGYINEFPTQLAVPVPKLDTAVIHVQKASPDGTCIIEGDEFHDVDIAVAAKKVIVTCEELVSDEWIRFDPSKNNIFGECVSAVVHAPFGAWPSQCYNYYDCDDAAMKEYDKASKYQDKEDAEKQIAKEKAKAEKKGLPYNAPVDPETFKDYLDKWVYSVKDNDELLDKIGGARLAKLKVIPGLGYAKR